MAKRSPILGYNHNVRYRGLMWHVQTEDSGLANPHLFTHLFHEGVIVSTRKLVYDGGSDEGAIKSLMQAQHKAVMKDLKRGLFDDKIDVYLVGTPGLLPRGVVDDGTVDGEPKVPVAVAPVEPAPPPLPPPLEELDPPTYRTEVPLEISRPPLPPPPSRTGTQPMVSAPPARTAANAILDLELDEPAVSTAATISTTGKQLASDSSAEIRLELGDDELGGLEELEVEADEPDDDVEDEVLGLLRRKTRDTEMQLPEMSLSDVPGIVIDDATRKTLTDGIPRTITQADRSAGAALPGARLPTGERAAVSAPGTGPRPPSRPAITPPTVAARPLAADPTRPRNESNAVEIYSPAPPSAEPPPGVSERPGQYAQHRKGAPIVSDVIRDRSLSAPIPSGLGKPRAITGQQPTTGHSDRIPTGPHGERVPTGHSDRIPTVPPAAVPPVVRQEPSSGNVARPRTLTPARIPPGVTRPTVAGSGGVVMTRPAVIVGAPPKPAPPPRVRKAREEEGRGFGQGLISEKSLDEVILAYLSEDADEK